MSTDAKWSDNAEFIPNATLADADFLMGITVGGVNSKFQGTVVTSKVTGPASSKANAIVRYNGTTGKLVKDSKVTVNDSGDIDTPGTLTGNEGIFPDGVSTEQVDATTVNVNGKLNLTDYIPIHLYVGSAGSNTNNGQIVQPLLTVKYADTNASDGTSLFIPAGTFSEPPSLSKRSGVNWFGDSKDLTTFTTGFGGSLGIDDTQWIATVNPNFSFNNITLTGTTCNFTPSAFIGGSIQSFNSVIIPPNFSTGRLTELNFNDSDIINAYILDVESFSMIGGINEGNFVYEIKDGDTVSDSIIIIKDVTHNGTLLFKTGYDINPANTITVTITNCPGITGISIDDNFQALTSFTINIDSLSMPSSGITNISGAELGLIFLTNVSNGIDAAVNGFNVNSNYFKYSGYLKQNFVACDGSAADTTGNKNTVFGRSASGRDGCFLATDSQLVTLFQPLTDDQFLTRFLNGYGFNTNSPKANFHVKAGSKDSIIFSAGSVIADVDLSNNEFNPYISGNDLLFKIKNNSGAVFTFNLNSLSGYVTTTGNQNISGTKTFTSPTLLLEVQNPLVSNATPINLTATTATISAAQLVGGVITLNPILAQTLTLPNAADIDAILGSISNNRGFDVLFVQQSAVATTLSPGTNTNVSGAFLTTGSVIIPAGSQRRFRIVRIDNTPTYTVFG